MATESSEGEDEGKIVGGSKHLVVDDDMREMTKNAAWSVSSCKPGNGVQCLRDDNCDTYWQLVPSLLLSNFIWYLCLRLKRTELLFFFV